ncbi:hypothetical protein DIPPA_26050 [Diplonema papillatum]|nr:hypothetical protein DIPPA_26050 [Diplonema papillatum]
MSSDLAIRSNATEESAEESEHLVGGVQIVVETDEKEYEPERKKPRKMDVFAKPGHYDPNDERLFGDGNGWKHDAGLASGRWRPAFMPPPAHIQNARAAAIFKDVDGTGVEPSLAIHDSLQQLRTQLMGGRRPLHGEDEAMDDTEDGDIVSFTVLESTRVETTAPFTLPQEERGSGRAAHFVVAAATPVEPRLETCPAVNTQLTNVDRKSKLKQFTGPAAAPEQATASGSLSSRIAQFLRVNQ